MQLRLSKTAIAPTAMRTVEKKLIKDLSEEKMSLELASMGRDVRLRSRCYQRIIYRYTF